ncbi:MAG TPA: kelch repeat-containing protein [Pyrinomonadaceae bacterium]|jgi:hypothetical protein|nr:kelch repeat-containing protein [Pyrinomonadaceae bacterium]
MTKEKFISSLLFIVFLTPAVFAQSARPAATTVAVEQSKPAAPQAISAFPIASLYSWQIRPNDMDGYFSSDIPQPVCGLAGGTGKIFIFSNFSYYPSKNFHNHSNAVRVGQITPPADSYQLLSSNVAGDIHSLPGLRQEFATTSILRSGDANHTIYLFGGKTPYTELDEVYSYTPTGGFSPTPVATIPARNGIAGKRSGAVAVPGLGKIYLFGGQQGGNTVLNQILEFDPATNSFTNRVLPPMPQGFHWARGMTKAVGTNNFIYLVGGKTTAYGAPNDLIYRFDVQTGVTKVVMSLANPSTPLTIPSGSGYPMITWDPSGNIRIIAASGNGASGVWTWGNIQAWILNDNYPGSPNDGRATLTPAPYNDATRARDMAGAVKCGDSTYLIGGTYGHGTTFQNRGMLVDKLGGQTFAPVKTTTMIRIPGKGQ